MNFGITLSNRGIPVGLCSARDLLALADAVEACPVMDSVWCGDALFVNRRLDALTLLAAVAGRTERVLLGPACMGSFALRNPLVFAYEWASLDVLSNGRTRLKRAIPMRRLGVPEDYPGLIAFLLSDDAAYITGQTISVSGGLTMHG